MSSFTNLQNIESSPKTDNWETPSNLLEEFCKKKKLNLKIDVCGTIQNRKFQKFFSKDIDGLSQEWTEDSFGNFPYSKIKTWIKYAYEQHKKHNINVLVLCFNKSDTKWYHDFVLGKAEIYPIKGRVKFLINGKPGKNSSPYPSVFILYRKKKFPTFLKLIYQVGKFNETNWKIHKGIKNL